MHFVVKVGTSSFRPLCHENVELINHNLGYTTAATGGEAPDYPWGVSGVCHHCFCYFSQKAVNSAPKKKDTNGIFCSRKRQNEKTTKRQTIVSKQLHRKLSIV
jgi:hypothetical protein